MQLPDECIRCHYTGFKKKCRDIVKEGQCVKFINLRGLHPQTGETVDRWGCADTFAPFQTVENTKRMNELGAAIESFRNEMVRGNERFLDLLASARQQAAPRTDGESAKLIDEGS